MISTKGGLKIKNFGVFSSQQALEPLSFRGEVEATKDNWEAAAWGQDGKCTTHSGDEFFIGETKHTPTTEEDVNKMTNDEKLERAFFFVEADSYAQFKLWQECRDDYKDVKMIQDGCGFIREIGLLYRKKGKRYHSFPVMISFNFAIIKGVYVCFYTSESHLTDWKMVEKFIGKHAGQYDSASRRAMTNAHNFHHCVSYCEKNH